VPAVHRVTARNAATTSENRIHDDAVARRHGFAGGLVPGVTLYGYLTRPVVDLLGRQWLERGTMSVRLQRPVYDGQAIEARAGETDGPDLALSLLNADGVVCASGRAGMAKEAAGFGSDAYPVAPVPPRGERPPADETSLAPGTPLATQWLTIEDPHAGAYVAALADDLNVYGPGGLAHPGFLILAANSALSSTVRLGPWVHTDSEVTNFSAVPHEAVVEVRGFVDDLFERGGHRFVRLDLMWLLGDRPVMRARHTAIYRLRVAP